MPETLKLLEYAGTGCAAAYVVLATRQIIWCWPAALLSNVLMLIVVAAAGLRANALLQIYFFGMSVYGWYEWRRGGAQHRGVRVHWWPASSHLAAVLVIALGTLVSGWLWSRTEAANPYLDSFTTLGSVVTTFMVARKVIENWIYWVLIDAAYIWLYVQNGLDGFAVLSVFYMIMAVVGLRSWIQDWREHRDAAAGA